MADQFIQPPADSGVGKKVAVQEVTRADGTTVVERQEMVPADPASPAPDAIARVSAGRLLVDEMTAAAILLELKRIRFGLGVLIGQDLEAIF